MMFHKKRTVKCIAMLLAAGLVFETGAPSIYASVETNIGLGDAQAAFASEEEQAAKKLQEEFSKNGNAVTQYVNDEDRKLKTTVWAKGITPPQMSEFQKDRTNVGQDQYIKYQLPYQPNKGWYDVNKTINRVQDAKLCYAAAASNSLHWWLEQNGTYIDQYLAKYPDDAKKQDLKTLRNSFASPSDSAIYKRYISRFASRPDGFWSDILVDEFVNGYVPNQNGATNHSEAVRDNLAQNGPSKNGGFFYDIFGTTLLTNRMSSGSFQTFGNDLKSHLMNGKLVLVDYGSGAISHVVTIWGAEYDTNGQISAVYLTDSDDETSSYAMVRYMVKNVNGKPILSTNINGSHGSSIGYMQTISLGQDIWEKRLNTDSTAQKIPLALDWSSTELIYNGSPRIPSVTATNIEQGDDVIVLVQGEQTNAGTYTAQVVLKGASAGKYELPDGGQKSFVIQKVRPRVQLTSQLNREAKSVDFWISLTGTNNEKPTGTITLKSGQEVIKDNIPVENGQASYTWTNLPLGNRRVTAEFVPSVDGVGKNYQKGTSKAVSINLPKKQQSELRITPIGNKKFGDPEFTLETTGGTGNGEVTYSCSANDVLSISGNRATITGAGTATITAVKAGDDQYDSISTDYTITVAKAEAPTIVYPKASALVYGQKLSESLLSGGSTEYGSFIWDNSEQVPAISNGGYAVRFLPNNDTLRNYETITQDTSTVAVAVSRANPSVTLNAQVVDSNGQKKVILTASVQKALYGDNATGTVSFMAATGDQGAYTQIASAVPVVDGTATYTWMDMPQQVYRIQAHYSGNQNYNAASGGEIRVGIEVEPQLNDQAESNDQVQSNGQTQPNHQVAVNGWYAENGERYWYDHGVMARDKEVYDPKTDAWYWFDQDGTMATDKDAFIPTNEERTTGKWVRYDSEGGMIKGEDFRYGGWYWFEPITGEMIKGFVFIPEEGTEGKWVYYDEINGQMHHGESCIDGNWYYFDEWTGEMAHGECYRNNEWYYYDEVTGIMAHGWVTLPDGTRAYYDEITGARR